MSEAEGFRRVASLADVPPNQLLRVDVDGLPVCLAHADGRIYAFRDSCTHKEFPLSAGTLADGRVECAWHGARFALDTGRAVRLPAVKPVATYEVRVEDGEILVATTP
ncbi:MAG: non-heme iron oxygenase ferredoxin subunit [Gemmatimonadetes bacterium]|nr:non-heme iron oxygenase ferredoxin subunit [Gemmatimonadota bacterium]